MSRSTFRRPSASMLVAILAVVLATAGTATAAKLLTGANIKNNSLTTVDVKNGTLGTADLSASARKSLRGATGAKGDTGAQGAPGAPGLKGDKGEKGDTGLTGPAALADVFSATLANYALPVTPVNFVVLSKTLPAGRYLLNAKANVVSPAGSGSITCRLVTGVTVHDSAEVESFSGIEHQLVLAGVSDSITAVSLSCLGGVASDLTNIRLTAVPVGNVG